MNDSHKIVTGVLATALSLSVEQLSALAGLVASVLTAGFMLACLVEKLRKNKWFPFGTWPFA